MPITVGQIAAIVQSGSSSQAISFGSLPSAASRIAVVGEHYSGTTGTYSATDNQTGNTYNSQNSTAHNNAVSWLLDAAGIGTPSATFTVTVTGSGPFNVALMELISTTAYYSPCAAVNGGAVSTSFAASVTAAAATSIADSIVIAELYFDTFGGSGYTTGWATPAGWTNASIINNGSGRVGRVDYQILTSVQTPAANWGSALTAAGATGNWEAALYVYSGSGGGGPTSPTPLGGPPRTQWHWRSA